MITLYLFELYWLDSFWEINIFKKCKQTFFGQKKGGKFSFLMIFLFNLFTFQICKNIKAKFS